MIAGALPFVLYLRAVRGDWSILRDRQSGVMLLILAAQHGRARSLAALAWRPSARGCDPARGVQRHLDADHDRLRLGRLRGLGPARGRDLLLPDVRRRLHRLDLRRDQGLPLPGAADRAPRPHPAPLHAACDHAAHLRRQALVGRRGRGRDGVPGGLLHGGRARRGRARRLRPGLVERVERHGAGDRQRRARASARSSARRAISRRCRTAPSGFSRSRCCSGASSCSPCWCC